MLSWYYRFRYLFSVGLIACLLPLEAVARTPDESEFLAATVTGDDVGRWLENLDKRPNSIGIFSARANPPMEQDYGSVMETEVLKNIRGRGDINVMSCPECRVPKISVKDDRLIITKGAPNEEAFRELGKRLGVEAFLELETYRTKLSVITQATLYQTSTGEVISAERFQVPALNLGDSAMQLIAEVGPGIVLAGKYSDSSSSDIPLAFTLLALEELGFGKGGLAIGGVFGGNSGSLGYAAPHIGFRGRFASTSVTYLFNFGAGFGLTGEAKGVVGRGALDVFIGSFTMVGLEGVYFQPLKSVDQTLQAYIGMHIGISLGR